MSRRRLTAVLLGAAALAVSVTPAQPGPDFEPAEVRHTLRHGPWPEPPARDPSNRASGDPLAIALGRRLFFDARLSAGGAIACATCHVPERAWTDGRARGVGLAPLDRNTPSLVDAARHRWLGWDGGADSLWAQGLRALVDPREMGADPRHVAGVVAGDPTLACLHERVFGRPPRAGDDEAVFVGAGKAMAAFVETLRSGPTAFDAFRDALARGDTAAAAMSAYPAAARRGLRTFVGSGQCGVCHVGPHFTNGEFHDVGVPYAVAPGRVDSGRHAGLQRLRADRFNLLGPYNDDRTGEAAIKTRHVQPSHANFGQFRTPSLRNVALTAPYMHDGRLATLRDVVRHYSRLDLERLHTHGEQLLRPLGLSEGDIDDLVAFLESLTDSRSTAAPPAATLGPCGG